MPAIAEVTDLPVLDEVVTLHVGVAADVHRWAERWRVWLPVKGPDRVAFVSDVGVQFVNRVTSRAIVDVACGGSVQEAHGVSSGSFRLNRFAVALRTLTCPAAHCAVRVGIVRIALRTLVQIHAHRAAWGEADHLRGLMNVERVVFSAVEVMRVVLLDGVKRVRIGCMEVVSLNT